MPRITCTILISMSLLLASRAAHAESHQAGEIKFEPYVYKTFDGQDHKAEMGTLWVRENRSNHSDRLIQLAFVRLKSTSTSPGAPIVFLSGGPGVPGIVMSRVPVYYQLMEKLRAVSDVILLDQRATGKSSPTLECPPGFAVPQDVFETSEKFEAALVNKARSCADFWRAKGVDVSAYNIQESADDLEDLRIALGAEKLSLLGHSYGTALGLEAMRRHSDRLQRVVLASVEGPGDVMHLPEVWDFDLRRISRLIGEDPNWKGSMPDAAALLKQVLDRVDRNPLRVTVFDRATNEKFSLPVGKRVVQFLIGELLPNGRSVGGLPALIQTLSQGDSSLLAPRVEDLYSSLRSEFSAMQFAMRCSQGWSQERQSISGRQATRAVLGDAMNVGLTAEFCQAAGSTDLSPTNLSSIWSAVPTPLLSGTLDVDTPPFQAGTVRWGLPNSAHIVVENGFHETLPSSDVQNVVVAFFQGEDVRARAVRFDLPEFLTVEQAKTAQERQKNGPPH